MRINISLTRSFFDKLKEAASDRGISVSEYIRFAVMRLWESENRK